MKRMLAGLWALMALLLAFPGAGLAGEEEALYPIREKGLWGYMNRQGETVIPCQWAQAWPFDGDTALVGTFPRRSKWANVSGDAVIDRRGNYIVPPREHVKVEPYAHAYRIRDDAGNCEGFLDKASGFYLPPQPEYSFVMLWGEDGRGPVAVENADGFTGYLDRTTGETVIPFRYTGDSDDVCFRDGYARPADEIRVVDAAGHELALGSRLHLIDAQGREMTFDNGIHPVSGVFDGRFVYSMTLRASDAGENREEPENAAEDGAKYLFSGEKIVPPICSVDGLTGEKTEMPDWYTVWEDDDAAVGYGIAAVDGTILSGPDTGIWHVWEPDGDGMLCIVADDDWGTCGHMDMDGNIIVPPRYRMDFGGAIPSYSFANGYAVIDDLGENWRETERYVILDTAGREVFSRRWGEDGFSLDRFPRVLENGLIWYREQGLWGLMRITEAGAEAVTEPRFESHVGGILVEEDLENQTDFAEGLHPVKMAGQWGYINEGGAWVIAPAWDGAGSFRDGLALVEKEGKMAYIDHGGSIVWQEP